MAASLITAKQLAARPALRNGEPEERDVRFSELDRAIRKPPASEGIDTAREISYALAQVAHVMNDTVRGILEPLTKELERLKADLTTLEGERQVQRREIQPLTVEAYWEMRACFICSSRASLGHWDGSEFIVDNQVSRFGPCEHREIEVALAEIERIRRHHG